MNIVALFIRRRIATTLLALGLGMAGMTAYTLLPVSPFPNIDIPTIVVNASMPGASPEIMASSVATPLERHLGTIAGVDEMTSRSNVNSTQIVLQFDINRDINGAARNVQAAINAARADLPAALRSNPTYRKFNPADFPIMILAMTSKTLSPGQIYDQASNIIQQKLSQVSGVGDVSLNGASLPAVRIELNPRALFKYGIGLADVRAAISAANANTPKGDIQQGEQTLQVYANDVASAASDYRTLIIAYRNGSAVRLQDVAEVVDGVENVRNLGTFNGQPAVLVNVTKQPGANVIEVVDMIRTMMPELQAALPAAIELGTLMDTTNSIRNSVHDVEMTLIIATILVILVVFLFLRNFKATLVPTVCVPLTLLGTFGVMYLLGFSLNNFSLMALIVSTGFVVDNTIVVLENVTRHLEAGKSRMQAALQGAQEVTFTVISMSISLVAVFFPVLLLGGLVGRIFHEFAITLTVAIIISMVISLTLTPMMCAYLDFSVEEDKNPLMAWSRKSFNWMQDFYRRTLDWSLGNPKTIVIMVFLAIGLNFYLISIVPKGFFPSTDEGTMQGGLRADQSISFQAMRRKFRQFMEIVRSDPAVQSVAGFTGGFQTNSGFVFATLKPLSERDVSADQVIARLRPRLAQVPGAVLFLQAVQDIRVGGRQGNAQYQFTLQADSLPELYAWGPKLTEALQRDTSVITDVDSDQQQRGLQVNLTIDRDAASRLGVSTRSISATLYDAFGQRQVSTIYNALNQYHVVMEVAPDWWANPESLKEIYVSTSGGALSGTQTTGGIAGAVTASPSRTQSAGSTAVDPAQAVRNLRTNQIAVSGRGSASTGAAVSTTPEKLVPLSAVTRWEYGTTPLAVNHQSMFVASTVSFNLAPGRTLSDAVQYVNDTMREIGVPSTLHGSFQGTARAFQQSLNNQLLLVLAALAAVYIVLGILYESYIHPITILSTLPSAGIGALLALQFSGVEFSIIAMIGVLLLIGIVKKNAIMMIDVALDRERNEGLDPSVAIHQAAVLRFRPILMTTMAAILGALPLALGYGDGAELRRPLGISIIGGLIVSQILTLYTTPVIYLYLDRFRQRDRDRPSRIARAMGGGGAGAPA